MIHRSMEATELVDSTEHVILLFKSIYPHLNCKQVLVSRKFLSEVQTRIK